MGKFRPAQRLSNRTQPWRFMAFGTRANHELSAMGLAGRRNSDDVDA